MSNNPSSSIFGSEDWFEDRHRPRGASTPAAYYSTLLRPVLPSKCSIAICRVFCEPANDPARVCRRSRKEIDGRGGGAGPGRVGPVGAGRRQNGSPRRQPSLVTAKASKTHVINVVVSRYAE